MFRTEDGPPDGPPILLIHGFASSHHAWDRVVPLLADEFRVIRVDLLGHGRTGGPAADAAGQAAAVHDLLSGRTGVTVVGHSFGADIAVALAGDPRIARVVVLTQGPDYCGARVPRLPALMHRPALVGLLFRGARPILTGVRRVLTRSRRPLAALVAGVCRDAAATDAGMLPIVLVDRRETLARRPLDVQLAAVDTRALVVLGSRDRLYGDRSAARYRAAGARVEIVADGTHALPQQHPAVLAGLLRELTAR